MAAWGGSQAVAESATPLAGKYGSFVTSRKRAANHPLSRANPGSDHNTANTTAYALDMATFRGAPLAYALARHFSIGGYRTGTYTNHYIRRGGATFRVQILWAVSGHFDHVHLGVRLVSGRYTPPRPKPKPIQFTRHEADVIRRVRAFRSRPSTRERRSNIRALKRELLDLRAEIRAAARKTGWQAADRKRRYDALLRVYRGG